MANWFSYNGFGDPNLAGSYQRMGVTPICSSGSTICSIYLNDNSATSPASITLVEDYIANALGTLIPQPAGGGIVSFVYLKSL